MIPTNKTAIQIWIIFQLFNIIPLFFLCLQFLYKGKHYTMACLSLTTIFDCIISVPIALKYHFIDTAPVISAPTNDPLTNNDTYSTNNTDMEYWNTSSSSTTMSLIFTNNTNLDPICIAQAFALYSTHLSIGFWIFCLMINMWLLLVKATNDIEMKWFKIHIIFSWCVPLFLTFAAFMLLNSQVNFGVTSSYYQCIISDGLIHIATSHIPFLLCMFIGLGLGAHASWALITYRTKFSRERKANKLKIPTGLCVRMILLCILFFILLSIKIDLLTIINAIAMSPICQKLSILIPHINAYFNTILTFGLFLIFGTTKEALRSLFLCTCCFNICGCSKPRNRSSISTFIGNDPSNINNIISIVADDEINGDVEIDQMMEMTIVESPPSTFGNLKRTMSFSKYKIGDDVLKFEEFGLSHVFRNYSISRNGRHNCRGSRCKLGITGRNGGDGTISSVKSFNRYIENQQNDRNGGNEHINDNNTVENKNTIGLTNDQIISDTSPSTSAPSQLPLPPPLPVPSVQPRTPG
ncbi:2842_t:CDS:2, partial [Scutellospora calospora]